MKQATIHIPDYIHTVLDEAEWRTRKNRHEVETDRLISDYLDRRSRHIKQPVMDFLFEYYAFRPATLQRWSPGTGVALEFEEKYELPEISECKANQNPAYLDLSFFPEKRIRSATWILQMLNNTQHSKPSFACFGMHEWAMVYRTNHPRHEQLPMRMEPDELADFVESRPLLCTHFDAFRFFTDAAKPLNRHQLNRDVFEDMEQPGCIHSNMDIYKWAFKLYPWISSELILKAFKLALDARRVDMQASPYDMREFGLDPIKIETEEGRIRYKKEQERIFKAGLAVRKALIKEYEYLLSQVDKGD